MYATYIESNNNVLSSKTNLQTLQLVEQQWKN